MSGNSGSQGASGMDTPVLPGYEITRDDQAREWVARSIKGDRELRGRNQDELELARNRVVVDIAEDMKRMFAYAPLHGYSPPPRT